ncbi:MAG: AAA family ATPase [Succinivibrio sp.]|nr:AAA family ATPase [Succinivibrio sp.]
MKKISQADGIKDFAGRNYIYVDKTEYIYSLVSNYKRVFFSRPRRFGKTLTLNIIGTLYGEGVEPYFKDTWIYDKWNFGQFPVLRLNFQNYRAQSVLDFKQLCSKAIAEFADEVELTGKVKSTEPDVAILELLNALKRKKQRIVILIDEYDYQMTANINNRELYEEFRVCIRNFYSNLKSNEQIEFLAVTGVTRLKDVSIFSAGSDIKDLTYESAFSQMIGFTRDEIKRFYNDYLRLGVSYEDTEIRPEDATEAQIDDLLDRMAWRYDGYCFDKFCELKVFSTWSVNSFLQEMSSSKRVNFGDYWFDEVGGGLPSILVNYLQTHTLDVSVLQQDDILISYSEFQSPTSLTDINQSVLMCQTGYLTLKSPANEDCLFVTLGLANQEVRKALSRLLMFRFISEDFLKTHPAKEAVAQYSAEKLVLFFNKMLAAVAYDRYPLKEESMVRALLQVFLQGSGLKVEVEKHNSKGRCDLMTHTQERHVVLELKYSKDGTDERSLLDDAVNQIKRRDYGAELDDGKALLRLALVFNGRDDKRKFTLWQEVPEA